MKKILVIGCPGSGKSTFSRKLHVCTGLPLCHLDLLYWNEDKTTVEKEVFLQRLRQVLNGETWIIDGNYASTLPLRLEFCDTVMFLDYPAELCLQGIAERRGKPRADMPWVETEVEDEEFLSFVRNFSVQTRPKLLKLLEEQGDKEIYTFKNRQEAEDFLTKLQKGC